MRGRSFERASVRLIRGAVERSGDVSGPSTAGRTARMRQPRPPAQAKPRRRAPHLNEKRVVWNKTDRVTACPNVTPPHDNATDAESSWPIIPTDSNTRRKFSCDKHGTAVASGRTVSEHSGWHGHGCQWGDDRRTRENFAMASSAEGCVCAHVNDNAKKGVLDGDVRHNVGTINRSMGSSLSTSASTTSSSN